MAKLVQLWNRVDPGECSGVDPRFVSGMNPDAYQFQVRVGGDALDSRSPKISGRPLHNFVCHEGQVYQTFR